MMNMDHNNIIPGEHGEAAHQQAAMAYAAAMAAYPPAPHPHIPDPSSISSSVNFGALFDPSSSSASVYAPFPTSSSFLHHPASAYPLPPPPPHPFPDHLPHHPLPSSSSSSRPWYKLDNNNIGPRDPPLPVPDPNNSFCPPPLPARPAEWRTGAENHHHQQLYLRVGATIEIGTHPHQHQQHPQQMLGQWDGQGGGLPQHPPMATAAQFSGQAASFLEPLPSPQHPPQQFQGAATEAKATTGGAAKVKRKKGGGGREGGGGGEGPRNGNGGNSNSYACGVCGKEYCRKSTLRAHAKQHQQQQGTGGGDKQFSCQICGKLFSQAANLAAHQRVHTGEKPFRCPLCLRPFSQSSSLVTHKRTHTGERPYPCAHCEKAFTDSSTLTKHLRTHTGQKPYACPLCMMKFSQSGNLHRHMKTHMNGGGGGGGRGGMNN